MIYLKEIKPLKLPGTTSFLVSFNYDQRIIDTIKGANISAIYHKKEKCWEIPTTYLHRAINLLSNLDDIDVEFMEEEPVTLNDMNWDNWDGLKTTPFEYQREAIKYGLQHDKWLLLDVPGLGKTPQMIWLAQAIKERDNIDHCLIICGVNTLKTNWMKEINIHSDLSAMILGQRQKRDGSYRNGSVAERLEDLKRPIDEFFIITNVETLRNDDIIKELNKKKPANKIDMIVVDELHHMKTPTSQQGKNFLKLKAKYQVGLTGTLLTNSPMDAYVPLKWIGADNSTYTNFKYFYCNFTGPFHNILTGYKNTGVLKDMIDSNSLRRNKDMLDLPEKTVINEFVEMEDAQRKFYNDVVNGIKDDVDKVEMNTTTLLSMVTRLRQATACPSILTSSDIESSKINRACELIDEITSNGEKVVVFSMFKETLNQLYNRLDGARLRPLLCTGDIRDSDISQNIDEFQNTNNNKVMLATCQKMGTGVTLTRASYAIFIDCPWTAADVQQCEDRIHRVGSKKPVFIYHLWNADSIDERVKEIVEDKEAISDFIIDDKVSDKSMASLRKYILDM